MSNVTTLPLPYPPVQYGSPYGYTPTTWICILFVVLFSVSTLLHAVQAFRTRLWFMFATVVVAGLLEVLGWAGRLWSSYSPTLLDPFLMQIVTTIIGPTPLVAANFVILGEIIRRLGTEYSRLSPRLYTIIFCTFDVISLVVQAVGGASASAAARNGEDASKGGNIMLGGIVFQMFTITIYALCSTEFLVRYAYGRPIRPRSPTSGTETSRTIVEEGTPLRPTADRSMKLMIGALVFDSVCLFIRAIYRTIELEDGWEGRIITTELYFNVLDGAMITLAIFTLNFFHPGYLLYQNSTSRASPKTEINDPEKI